MPALFVARPNRFLVVARVGSRRVRAASSDPGRLSELLRPGARLLLAPATPGSRRRTRYTVVLVRKGRAWVSVVPALANAVLAGALARGGAPGLRDARVVAREVRHGRSRFDFLLLHCGRHVLVEVKSATLVENGVALFPDAPTARGARHVRELTEHVRRGGLAAVVFVVQRDDATALRPHAGNDPALADALGEASRAGVRVLAYACRATPQGVTLERRIPVLWR
ncbi:MAG TPA: DNA/RNA nuclease SfsA [Vicinamibacteria bacterium]|nr:DNA/RNA nuclease SfsA [Vicinamibacteria bacterium]